MKNVLNFSLMFLFLLTSACQEQRRVPLAEPKSSVFERESLVSTSEFSTSEFTVFNKSGEPINLMVDNNTHVCIMATWCPYSKQLKDILNDSVSDVYIKDRRLVFLFAEEWPSVESQINDLVEAGEYTQEEAEELIVALKTRANWGPLFDESFLADLQGDHYYLQDESGIEWTSFPDCYSHKKNEFGLAAIEWNKIKLTGSFQSTISTNT